MRESMPASTIKGSLPEMFMYWQNPACSRGARRPRETCMGTNNNVTSVRENPSAERSDDRQD
jgi:hypothetical protein